MAVRTVYAESFNKADGTTLGPDQTWTEVGSDLTIVGNAVRNTAVASPGIATVALPSVTNNKSAKITVKTHTGTSEVGVMAVGTATQWYGVSITGSGAVRSFQASTTTGAIGAMTSYGTVTLTTPYTLEARVSQFGTTQLSISAYYNGTLVGHSLENAAALTQAGAGFMVYATSAVTTLEVDAFEAADNTGSLPTSISGYLYPADGIAWVGPFISSAGNVYILGADTSSQRVYLYKATDPTVSFSLVASSFSTFGDRSVQCHQVGDVLHIANASTTTCGYRTFDMATDTLGAAALTAATIATPFAITSGNAIAKRSTGGDVILAYNTTGVVNMGKTYGRVAARRVAGGTTAGAETSIGNLTTISTSQQTESIESAVLGTSDRVHLIFSTNSATAAAATGIWNRTVRSTDNLDGTTPATGLQQVASNAWANVAPSDSIRAAGHASCSAAGLLALPYAWSTGWSIATATSADAPTWTVTTADSGGAVANQVFGSTTNVLRFGGVSFDGTDMYVAWMRASLSKLYSKSTTSGASWSAGASILGGSLSSGQIDHLSGNIYQRGSSVVFALLTVAGSWYYDEIFLRTVTGPQTITLTAATLTAQPQALTRTAGGIALTLTNASLAATAQPLTITNLPPPANLPLSPASITAQAQALTRTAGGAAPVLSFASVSAAAQPLTLALGGISLALSPGSVAVQAQPLTVVISQQLPLSPATVSVQPQPLTRTAGAVSVALSPATVTAQAQTLTPTPGAVSVALAPAVVTATPQPLSITAGAPGGTSLSLSVASVSLQAQPLALTPGPASATLSAALLTAQPQPLTATFGATAIALTPATAALQAQPLAITLGPPPLTLALGFASVAFQAQPLSAAYAVARPLSFASVTTQPQALTATHAATLPLSAASSTVQPQPLTLTVGGVALALTPASVQTQAQPLGLSVGGALALAAASISVQPQPLTRTVGGIAVALYPASTTVQAQPLTLVVAAPNALALSPATITFQPQSLTRTTTVAPVLSPATVTLTAQTLTLTLGGISVTLTAASVTAQAQTLIISAGLQVVPALLTVQAQPLTVTAAVAKPIGTATLQVVAQTLALIQGAPPTFITLGSATVTLQARPLIRTVGGAAITLIPISVAVQAVQLGIATDFHMKMGYILRHPYTNLSAQHRWTVGEPSHRYESLPV